MKKILSVLLRIILVVGILLAGFLLLVFLAGFFVGLTSGDTEDIESMADVEQTQTEVITDLSFERLAMVHSPGDENGNYIYCC